MPLHLGRSSAEMQEQTREARRFLQNNTRNDWSYPDAPHVLPWDYPTDTPSKDETTDAKAKVIAHTSQTSQPTAPPPTTADFQPIAWRERTYSSGESDSDSSTQERTYETPDDVATAITERKARRKRKRQQLLEDEMTWNVGLAHWSARRNIWTAAQYRDTASTVNPSTTVTPSTNVTPSTTATSTAGASDINAVLPVAPPLLPTHPVRARITTSTYSDIYTKIILQGRTPSIPINLRDMTRALVQGWKEEGNWPPIPATPEASFAKRGRRGEDGRAHVGLRKGVQAVGRVLGFGGPAVPVESGRGLGQL